ncbi:MAG: toprim domain-containing protein [Reichenbachiella sp.]|uniref:toprim domain-containing protein n=1 Tax=Reichenbachiella sp. TaxID=2184521 RepID=UPI0032677669
MTKIDFSSFKHQINLTQYAAYLGYEIDRKKSTRNSIAMRKGSKDKIIISKRSGNWIYFSVYDDQDSGTIVDFIKNRTSKSLFEISQELQVWISGNIALPEPTKYVGHVEERQPDPRRIQRLFNYCTPACGHEYLKNRGITAEALKSPRFSGRVFQDRFNNAVFPHFKEKQVCALELKGKNIDLFVGGSEKTLWRSNTRKGDDTLIISETPIDALSYQILHALRSAFYTSTCGGFSPLQSDIIRKLVTDLSWVNKVILITDNDDGGDAITGRLNNIVTSTNYTGSLTRHSPNVRGLDWNDVLRNRLGI